MRTYDRKLKMGVASASAVTTTEVGKWNILTMQNRLEPIT